MPAHARELDARILGKILVVEYERPVREMLTRWLRAAGQSCRAVADIAAAEAALDEDFFDLVIMDVRTPRSRDFDFLLKLRNERSDLPVLVATDCKDPRYATTALSYGAWGYLVKPVELKDLLSQVSRILERSAPAHAMWHGRGAIVDSRAMSMHCRRSEPTGW